MDIPAIRKFIADYLNEDVGDGDHTSLATIPAGTQGKAKLLVKENGILAGVDIALQVFDVVDSNLMVDVFLHDGAAIKKGDVALNVTGSVHSILKAERLVLNIMQRMSAIATQTHSIVELIKGTGTKILDTRKTTPGFRYFEKLAVKIGGGVNHRFGLYDMVLIKDNHVDYSGGISNAINNAKQYLLTNNKCLDIEIEVRNFDELNEAIKTGGVLRIMLDNFSTTDLKKAVEIIGDQFETEASGGITIDNVRAYAECGVNYISIGALTHSVKSLDLSLKAVNE
ncbi:nicotinate-nucleotide pyrophosphorylase [carboxylating] [Mucilaginibacter gracilis]|uniref:Probable nicotinate-nucleotide pyrophosphorylase [carboxylating] n=1 Tax=Mucilaginibacter gracilis TaxID=423350 RepID=A0A495J2J1_9SPHI|nr:carboxylating nicotinate-nucleotide diphosphorylase [Mucilaginibacter gracilis]RKR82588.1 nicotinate-nucleotide pyrophosphorylase [carboxylating] [Mucilaginibacter gracilis]